MTVEGEEEDMEIKTIKITKPEDVNFILGQSHFIKTVEDLHEAMVNAVPGIEFGIAFCEASGPALVRVSGTSEAMLELAKENALALSAGHVFLIFLGNAFPLNVLNAVKGVPEVCRVFCATANPVEVVLAETEQGRGVLGVIDGVSSKGVEGEEEVAERLALLRTFGYKLG
jgi:adenosine/AMP kinase